MFLVHFLLTQQYRSTTEKQQWLWVITTVHHKSSLYCDFKTLLSNLLHLSNIIIFIKGIGWFLIYVKYTALHFAKIGKKWKLERENSRLLKLTWFLSKKWSSFIKSFYDKNYWKHLRKVKIIKTEKKIKKISTFYQRIWHFQACYWTFSKSMT